MSEVMGNRSQDGALSSEASGYESEARAEGWRPLEEFEGPEERWVDAETFVKRGREINPILKRNNERLKKELDGVRGTVAELREGMKSLQEYNAKIEERAYTRAVRELKDQKKRAIAEGDNETLAEVEDQLEELREQKPEAKKEPPAPAAPKLDPIFVAWRDENSGWFNDDNPDLMDYAEMCGRKIKRQDPSIQGRAMLDAITKMVKKDHPEKFGGRRSAPAMVEGTGDGGGAPKGGDSIHDLPNEARAECAALCKEPWYIELAKKKGLSPQAMYKKDYLS